MLNRAMLEKIEEKILKDLNMFVENKDYVEAQECLMILKGIKSLLEE